MRCKDREFEQSGKASFALTRWTGLGCALVCCAMLTGCLRDRDVDNKLLSQHDLPSHKAGVLERYRVGCPDILGIHIEGRYALDAKCEVGPDGRIDLGQFGKPRVEGQTLPEIVAIVAHHVGVQSTDVQVQVAQFRSQQLILFGQVVGWQRAVPYQGQETVLDVLKRVGGITPGAEPQEVYVVRSHISEGHRPEVFHVDLDAIVLKHDYSTNLRVEPYDQIYVGETRQARIDRFVPPWLRPIYQALWEIQPSHHQPQEKNNSFSSWIRVLFPFGQETPREPPPHGKAG
jgi:protein involved in polysaccharide export with SLBB domain